MVFRNGNHEGVSKMDASRNILILNVTPFYSNERDFIYLLFLLVFLICKLKASKKFMVIQAGGESLGGSRREGREVEGVYLAGQSGRVERIFLE